MTSLPKEAMAAMRGDLVARKTKAIYERFTADEGNPVKRMVDETMLYASRGTGKVSLLVTGTGSTAVFYIDMDDLKAIITEAEAATMTVERALTFYTDELLAGRDNRKEYASMIPEQDVPEFMQSAAIIRLLYDQDHTQKADALFERLDKHKKEVYGR